MNQNKIKSVITDAIQKKLKRYSPESKHMPFHTRLLGKDRMALYSFIQSLNTTFGTSIFEPVAKAIAENHFKQVKTQYIAGKQISSETQIVIQNIMDGLVTSQIKPNQPSETDMIRSVCLSGENKQVKPTKVDLYLQDNQDNVYLIDIKTAKPNKGGFKEFKRTLLEWSGVYLHEHPKATVHTLIAIPYNPYEPKPYERWTMAGMLDLTHELKIAEEFWDFLGGKGTYENLLDCFEEVGIEMRDEIDNYFERFDK